LAGILWYDSRKALPRTYAFQKTADGENALRKTRATGAAVLISYIGVFIIGQTFLKSLFSRPRPCTVDPDFALLIARPTSSSFPSTHSAWSFAGAAAIFQNHRKAGLAAFALAALIAFSRMYLFVHFPTDILAGMVLGILTGILAVRICRKAAARAGNRATENQRQSGRRSGVCGKISKITKV